MKRTDEITKNLNQLRQDLWKTMVNLYKLRREIKATIKNIEKNHNFPPKTEIDIKRIDALILYKFQLTSISIIEKTLNSIKERTKELNEELEMNQKPPRR